MNRAKNVNFASHEAQDIRRNVSQCVGVERGIRSIDDRPRTVRDQFIHSKAYSADAGEAVYGGYDRTTEKIE